LAADDLARCSRGDAKGFLFATLSYAATASNIHAEDGDYARAARECEDAIAILFETPSADREPLIDAALQVFANATAVLSHAGDAERAIQIGELALRLTTVSNEYDEAFIPVMAPLLVQVSTNLSMAYSSAGEAAEAMRVSTLAVDWARELAAYDPDAHSFGLAKALDSLAVDHLGAGDVTKGLTLEAEALSTFAASLRIGEEEDIAAAQTNYAHGLLMIGDTDAAREHIASALAIYGELERAGRSTRFPQVLARLRRFEVTLKGERNRTF